MAIVVNCGCGRSFEIPEKYAGKNGKCPECGAIVEIPAISEEDLKRIASGSGLQSMLSESDLDDLMPSESDDVTDKIGVKNKKKTGKSANPITKPGTGVHRKLSGLSKTPKKPNLGRSSRHIGDTRKEAKSSSFSAGGRQSSRNRNIYIALGAVGLILIIFVVVLILTSK